MVDALGLAKTTKTKPSNAPTPGKATHPIISYMFGGGAADSHQ
jgi:hypothetical protein